MLSMNGAGWKYVAGKGSFTITSSRGSFDSWADRTICHRRHGLIQDCFSKVSPLIDTIGSSTGEMAKENEDMLLTFIMDMRGETQHRIRATGLPYLITLGLTNDPMPQ
jgi:hypothetical protein